MPRKPIPIVRLSADADPQFVEAFAEIAARIAATLSEVGGAQRPVKMFLAGGAAVHFYTGARTTSDVDAAFSTRLLLPDDLDVNYIDAMGQARLLYFNRHYNDTRSLMHEDAQDDSLPVPVFGVDATLLEVRLLTPVDLAVSKIARFEGHDQRDIESLARGGLITADAVRQRADDALGGYVGNVSGVRVSIELACQLIARVVARREDKPRLKPATEDVRALKGMIQRPVSPVSIDAMNAAIKHRGGSR